MIYMLTVLMFQLLFKPMLTLKISDTFYYCSTQQDNPIFDIDGSCIVPTPDGKLL